MCRSRAAAILSVVPGVGAVRGIALLADIPDRQSGDGRPERVVRREDAVIAVPVLARLWDEIRKPGNRNSSRNSNGETSTPPLAPGCVDFRERPGPTQLAALCRGIT
ncbi:MAG: hypothetical protein WD060_09155 [Pirellulales bacterium]